MKEQNKRITEQDESIKASNAAAATAITSQAEESAKIEETRTTVMLFFFAELSFAIEI